MCSLNNEGVDLDILRNTERKFLETVSFLTILPVLNTYSYSYSFQSRYRYQLILRAIFHAPDLPALCSCSSLFTVTAPHARGLSLFLFPLATPWSSFLFRVPVKTPKHFVPVTSQSRNYRLLETGTFLFQENRFSFFVATITRPTPICN